MIRVLKMMVAAIWRLFGSLWADRRLTLHSSLSADECLERLKAELGSTFVMGGTGPVIGRVSANQVTLRRDIFYGNSFATIVFAAVNEMSNEGSEVRCLIAARDGVRAMTAVWFGGLILFLFLAVAMSVAQPSPEMWIFIAAPIPMLIFGVLLVAFCRYLARDDEGIILGYLRKRLEAQ